MKPNTIILKAKGELIDEEARAFCLKIDRRLENTNERTKKHTIEIRELIKRIDTLIKKILDGNFSILPARVLNENGSNCYLKNFHL